MNPKANHGLFAAITGTLKPLNESLGQLSKDDKFPETADESLNAIKKHLGEYHAHLSIARGHGDLGDTAKFDEHLAHAETAHKKAAEQYHVHTAAWSSGIHSFDKLKEDAGKRQ